MVWCDSVDRIAASSADPYSIRRSRPSRSWSSSPSGSGPGLQSALCFTPTGPLCTPEDLAHQTIYHDVKVEHLQEDNGIVTIEAQRRRHVFRLFTAGRVTMANFYVGRNGRLNHPPNHAEYARVAIAGSDFVARLAGKPVTCAGGTARSPSRPPTAGRRQSLSKWILARINVCCG